MSTLFDMTQSAQLSPCRNWRYTLRRQWSDGPLVAWLMFNPSTADETQDDPTIRKCIGFSKRWGYGHLVIINLFAIRSTDARKVANVQDAIGPLNDIWIIRALTGSRELICAWGCGQHMKRPHLQGRPGHILSKIRMEHRRLPIRCLGLRGDGHPKHPLMLAYSTPRIDFEVLA